MKKTAIILFVFISLATYSQTIYTANTDFYLKVAMGEVPGYSSVNKFGHNPAATTGDDVWGGGGVYAFYPSTAQAVEIASTDADDNSTGTGARTAIVYGLGTAWQESSEEVTLNGTTPVDLDSSFIRLFRCVVLTAGSSGANEGTLTVKIDGAGTTGIQVDVGDGQTQQTIYTIPANKTAYFVKGYVGMAGDDKAGEVAEFQWLMRPNTIPDGAWAVKGQVSLNSIGTGTWQYLYGIPAGGIPEKTDIRIRVIAATATLGVVGGYDLILKDN